MLVLIENLTKSQYSFYFSLLLPLHILYFLSILRRQHISFACDKIEQTNILYIDIYLFDLLHWAIENVCLLNSNSDGIVHKTDK